MKTREIFDDELKAWGFISVTREANKVVIVKGGRVEGEVVVVIRVRIIKDHVLNR